MHEQWNYCDRNWDGNGGLHQNRTVVLPPEITSQPEDLTISELDEAVFTCEFIGDSVNAIWHQKAPVGGWENISSEAVTVSTLTSSRLSIPRAAATLSGYQFRCVVSNLAGNATSGSAVLTVNKRVESTETIKLRGIGSVDGFSQFVPFGISDDGNTISGKVAAFDGNGERGVYATYLKTGEDRVMLWDLAGGTFDSSASDISDDNLIIVGTGTDEDGTAAFRWTESLGMEALGDSALGNYPTLGNAISGDGSSIVGTIVISPFYEFSAYRWTSGTGMVVLSGLQDTVYSLSHKAFDVSSDGSAIVGFSGRLQGSPLISRAVCWNAQGEIFDFNEIVINNGGSLEGWSLEQALAISPDGNSVVGIGTNVDPAKGDIRILSGLNGIGSTAPPGSLDIGGVSLIGSNFTVDVPTQAG